MTSTRQRILFYLQKRSAASVSEIARALGTGPANIRHHLSILTSDGRVSVAGKKQEERGRPEKLYSLSRALRGDNLSELVEALLEVRLEGALSEEKGELMTSLGRRMAGAGYSAATPPARRLADLMERLNKLHYDARWEAGAGGPNVIFGQCPYAAVIEAHPELCQADLAMLEASLALHAEQKTRLHPACLFLLR